jgi:hypothetical protein
MRLACTTVQANINPAVKKIFLFYFGFLAGLLTVSMFFLQALTFNPLLLGIFFLPALTAFLFPFPA